MRVSTIAVLLCGSAVFIGCGSATPDGGESSAGSETARADGHEHTDHEQSGHTHGAWWCSAHGVPEDECALCKTSLVASFKEKGDWCELHDRPESQCFLCDPTRFETFAARYEAKYGKLPPRPAEIADAGTGNAE